MRKAEVFGLIADADHRVGFNALWVFTHLSDDDMPWLTSRRNDLIDLLLATDHIGKQRLILSLLDKMPAATDEVRTDYLDYCLSRINSALPYGIRAYCLKQAFAQCSRYPELVQELKAEIELMEQCELSAGLISARRQLLRRIARLEKDVRKRSQLRR